ncbi:hypothetical protein BX616_004033 [Lobosporangium transversale]|uniref:Aminotransferase n=1 Tax=Lobosporangium transversale TaxID=64571 RepID=A0A1Y2G9D2_9FUNG|nr:hypothetical protein BCR41DRAFT_362573 [Lobosporangium transversale]KAF9916333.1 hypothetical protein BX616_004033 [Lobosporangium transversale]ORZ04723.1 hypothetical protein BCR41DRAFT_362573 [Lobosporangium transversale]|eukprot:XP_021876720.1 hypothetical protein BCR41DRAFT_362573 [Lobosporangium transversale]
MLPRNVLAIRRTIAGSTAVEIITMLTSKSSKAILLDYPSGAYTGMRTFNKIGIMDFTGHTNRLADSLQQIKFHALTSRVTTPGTDTDSHNNGHDRGGDHENNDINSLEKEDPTITSALAAFRTREIMKLETTNLVSEGLKFYYKQAKEYNSIDSASIGETKVTVLCTWDSGAKEPTLVAHFEPLIALRTSRCQVEVHGAPRHQASAKDSQWVRVREAFEAALNKDSNEALLLDDKTQDVYEGLSSNFFALDRQHHKLLTAPLGSVLQGTIMKVVLDVCKSENIPVDFTFPNLKNVDDWEGAFITSTSRLVLPIEKLVLPSGSVKQFGESPTIDLIRNQVLNECRKRVEKLISEKDI